MGQPMMTPSISVRRIVGAVLISVVLLYAGACLFLFVKQRSMLYFPTKGFEPAGASTLIVENSGAQLKLWIRQSNSPNAVIYFGGNSEDVGLTFDDLAKSIPDQDLYLVNYRGYGGSTGSPSESALFSDALAIYDRVHQSSPNISVFGRSLGSGVAVYLASQRPVEKLVLATPYDSIANVAQKHYRIFPVSLLLTDRFDSASRVKDVKAETLALLAENDQVIPLANSQALIDKFQPGQVAVSVIPRSDHNSIGLSHEYFDRLGEFLKANHQ